MTTLFISDLHLCCEQPTIINLFLNYLRLEAIQASNKSPRKYSFSAWIGNDYVEPALAPVIDALAALTNAGVPVFVMAGNRDFSQVNFRKRIASRMTRVEVSRRSLICPQHEEPSIRIHYHLTHQKSSCN